MWNLLELVEGRHKCFIIVLIRCLVVIIVSKACRDLLRAHLRSLLRTACSLVVLTGQQAVRLLIILMISRYKLVLLDTTSVHSQTNSRTRCSYHCFIVSESARRFAWQHRRLQLYSFYTRIFDNGRQLFLGVDGRVDRRSYCLMLLPLIRLEWHHLLVGNRCVNSRHVGRVVVARGVGFFSLSLECHILLPLHFSKVLHGHSLLVDGWNATTFSIKCFYHWFSRQFYY